MAAAAAQVNLFRTITTVVGTSTVGIYTAPTGYTGVVLLAQVTNVGSSTQTISFNYSRGGTETEVVRDLAIPPNDTAVLVPGKLVVETNNSLSIVGSTATDLKFIASILETSNL